MLLSVRNLPYQAFLYPPRLEEQSCNFQTCDIFELSLFAEDHPSFYTRAFLLSLHKKCDDVYSHLNTGILWWKGKIQVNDFETFVNV